MVEGYLTGLHRSPFHGFSVEFSQHRPYMAGDSLRFVDWKVYGRTGRYFIKQFEEETNLRCTILLDISKSMLYSSGSITKGEYAKYLAAALAYLIIQQRDATGLVLFDEAIRKLIPSRSMTSHLHIILHSLDQYEFGTDTNISDTLHLMAERLNRRGLIILISDLLDDPAGVLNGLKHFRHNQHEVLVFHVLDRQEVDFNFRGDVQFEDLESQEKIKTQPAYIQKSYCDKFEEFLNFYKINFSNNRIDYQKLFTDTSFDVALTQYLLKRKRLF